MTLLSFLCMSFFHELKIEAMLDDSVVTEKGNFLVGPIDAIFFDKTLFVTDIENSRVFIYQIETSQLKEFGRQGQAPYEFLEWPEHLEVEDNLLIVYGHNAFRRHTYTLTGEPVSSKRLGKDARSSQRKNGVRYSVLSRNSFSEHHSLWKLHLPQGVKYLGKPSDKKEIIWNISGPHSYLDVGEDGNIGIANRTGGVSLYSMDGQKKGELILPTGSYSGNFKFDKARTIILQSTGVNNKVYTGGTPVIGFAIKNIDRMWVLINDENHEDPEPRTLLLSIDRKAIQPYEFIDLGFVPEVIRYDYGFLTICSRNDQKVVVFSVPSDVEKE